MFKVGDIVVINYKYRRGSIDTVRGVITAETAKWGSEYYIINWEDGQKGETLLNPNYNCLLLV
jgi:hypothetical protein